MAFSGTTPNLTEIDADAMERGHRIGDDPRPILVLLSGGQDSTTCLFWARREFPNSPIHALTVFYGQRHDTEVGAATHIAGLAGCASHEIVDLSPALGGSQSALVNKNLDLTADGGFRDDEMPQGLPSSFVPGRNLVFLSVAAAHAAKRRCQAIVTGVCQTDYSGYPDCRDGFIRAATAAIRSSLPTELHDIEVYTPLLNATKADTVRLMHDIAAAESVSLARGANVRNHGKVGEPLGEQWTSAWHALSLTVTCYHGQRPGCGACPACQLRRKGFEEAGIADPAGTPMTSVPRKLDPVQGTPVAPRGPESSWEARAAEDGARAATEVDALDHPERVIRARSIPVAAGVSITVVERGDAIELRADTRHGMADSFTLRQAADALDAAGLIGDDYKLDALDFRADIRPDRNVVHRIETGTRTIELSEAELQELADASVAVEIETSSGGKTGGVVRETVRPLDTAEPDGPGLGGGKSWACEVPQ